MDMSIKKNGKHIEKER